MSNFLKKDIGWGTQNIGLPFDSTTQPLNHSTTQPLNHSTTQPLNHSTTQPLNHSTTQ
jgi:hypothetical protein